MADQLATTVSTRIADLSPSLSALSTRSIRAVVTLIWPYSSSNSALTVLLAEPDFRLRKSNGQVRVRFLGSTARIVFESGIGSGDDVTLSLDGVEWVKDESVPHTPGRSVEWELKYTERLLLQVQESGTEKIALLNIDHPEPLSQPEVLEIASVIEIPPSPPKSVIPTARSRLKRSENSEWASPAFIKRARVSYGSLFESGYDMFTEENGTVSGNARKRTLFNRNSSSWRYSSRSASPEIEASDNEIVEIRAVEAGSEGPAMTDEACQTIGLEGDDETETLVNLPVGRVSVSQGELVGKAIIDEGVTIDDESSKLIDVVQPAGPLLMTGVEVQKENNYQGIQTEGKEISQLSPWLHSAVSDNLPTELSVLPSTPAASTASDVFRRNGDNAGLDVDENRSYRAQHDFSSQEITQSPQIDEVDNIHNLSSVAHVHRDTPAEEFGLSQMLLTQEHNDAEAPPTYPDPGDSLNSEHYPRSPYYVEKQSHSAFVIANKSQHHLDAASDMKDRLQEHNHGYEDRPHPDTAVVHPPTATSLLGGEEVQYGNLYNPSIHDTKALHPQTASIMMSRSQSAQSEMIDLTEDSDVEGSRSEAEVQINADYDEVPVREEWDDVEEEREESYDEDEDEDEDHRLSDRERVENEATDEDRVNLAYSRGSRWEESSTGEESEDYDELMDDQEGADYESSEEGGGSAILNQLPRGEPEVIDLLSSDDECVGDGDGHPHPRIVGDDGSAINAQHLDEGEASSDQDADGEAEEYEDERREEYIKQNTILDAIGLIQAERVHEDRTSTEAEKSVGGLSQERKSESQGLGDQRLTEVQRSTSEPTGELQSAFRAEDLNKDPLYEEKVSHDLQTYSTANDDADIGIPRLVVAEEQVSNTGAIPPVKSTTGKIKHTILPLSGAIQEEVFNLEAKAPQDDQAMIEDYALEIDRIIDQDEPGDQSLSAVEDNSNQDENTLTLKRDQASPTRNGQLPTPDATQITTVAASDPSLYSSWEPQLLQESQNPLSEPGSESQNFLIEDTVEIKEISSPAVDQAIKQVIGEDNHLGNSDLIDHVEEITKAKPKELVIQAIETSSDSVTIDERPSTPRKSKLMRTSEPNSGATEHPSIRSDGSPAPEFFDASATLASEALDSPSNRGREQESPLSDRLRTRLTRPLHTRLGDFTTLKVVRFNPEKKIDVLAIVTSIPPEPSRAKNGPRHFHLHFKVTDASLMPTAVIPVHIFRPFKIALPNVKPGDGILLRNFLAKAEPKAGFGLRSDENSSWVVFKENGMEEVRGPPVELGDEEREHIVKLGGWYHGLDAKAKERIERASAEKEKEN